MSILNKLFRGRRDEQIKGERDYDEEVIVVRSRERLAIAHRIGRYPAAVWTLILWLFAGAVNIAFALSLPQAEHLDPVIGGMCIGLTAAMVIVLLILGDRTPQEALIGMAVLSSVMVTALIITAGNPVTVMTNALGYVAIIVYASYWFTRRASLLIATLMSATYIWALYFHGYLPGMIATWTLLSTILFGIAFILTGLVHDIQVKAMVDPLTGLLNRVGFEPHIRDGGRTTRASSPRQIVFIDLDGLKAVNDTYGHEAGDEIMRELGYAWRGTLRKDDIAVRSGGDEFILVLPRTSEKVGLRVIERLREISPIGFSFGMTEWPVDVNFDVVSPVADALLYENKDERKRMNLRADRDDTPVDDEVENPEDDPGI